ncbi:MAG: bacillithiol system redox-active protein YtxJ [Saprospiraceae bacterium]
MNWKNITQETDLVDIKELSKSTACLIYKHSTRCTMSEMMKFVLENEWNFEEDELRPYYLDILAHKSLAAKIADDFQVYHQSPQVLLIQNGECTYDEDHRDISIEEIREHLEGDVWNF